MGRDVKVEVVGLNEMKASINRLLNDIPGEVSDALLEDAEELRDEIKANAPVGKTGNLKKGIVAGRLKSVTKVFKEVAAFVRAKAPHHHLVEYGHGGPNPAPPHPYYRPAIRKYRKHHKTEAALLRLLRKHGGT